MNMKKKKIFKISLISTLLLISLWILKDFNLSWVEVNPDYAKVTINFLFPMNKDKLPESISLSHQLPYASQFDYSIEWLTDSVVCIKLQEQNLIKGQKVQLIIKEAPSKFSFIARNASINIQFSSDIAVLEPTKELLVASESSFKVKFNTPMNKNKLYKFLQCDAAFYIEPESIFNSAGKKLEDTSVFKFTPKTPLINGQKYILSFRKGMPSQSGALLKQDTSVILIADIKPIIALTYPENNSKWIGLYPRMKIETDSPTVAGYLTLGNETIKGKNLDPYHIEFLLNKVLDPDTTYQASFQVKAKSGELSAPKAIQFTTVRIDTDRLWIEVLAQTKPKINIYKGNKVIKRMICSTGDNTQTLPLGTYYTRDKGEAFIDPKNREGANFWVKINDTCLFQGLIRNEYWQVKDLFAKQLGKQIKRSNIILKDEDARWLYDNTPVDTMIIIHQ
ncbi:L,D-transpeptidase [Cellulosilyticum sp. I15G10I2]|uniref:L,D-transpeptidase n=1 Tax=Cellulosilyticum sp. I15G10I2 TaxID=1892843 RepID=UPI00085C3759|nr:L,D-transpeptidase [Cellulosilyticum sp. I15G10I2]